MTTTACTQPGCTGSILDGYCDVCGSPARPSLRR
jgi:serine/threonine-protein kinase PknG